MTRSIAATACALLSVQVSAFAQIQPGTVVGPTAAFAPRGLVAQPRYPAHTDWVTWQARDEDLVFEVDAGRAGFMVTSVLAFDNNNRDPAIWIDDEDGIRLLGETFGFGGELAPFRQEAAIVLIPGAQVYCTAGGFFSEVEPDPTNPKRPSFSLTGFYFDDPGQLLLTEPAPVPPRDRYAKLITSFPQFLAFERNFMLTRFAVNAGAINGSSPSSNWDLVIDEPNVGEVFRAKGSQMFTKDPDRGDYTTTMIPLRANQRLNVEDLGPGVTPEIYLEGYFFD